MSYVPNTSAEQQEMLRTVGASSIEDLLTPIPEAVRLKRPLELPPSLAEPDLRRLMLGMAEQNADLDHYISFLGAGTYDHFVPSLVPALVKRSEFLTSYTPYQPEVSQGMLQAIYEYQTMVCQLTNMDVANASLYDGSTAVVEGALMAVGPSGRGEVLVLVPTGPAKRGMRPLALPCRPRVAALNTNTENKCGIREKLCRARARPRASSAPLIASRRGTVLGVTPG